MPFSPTENYKTIGLSLSGLLLLVVTGWFGFSEVEQQIKENLRDDLAHTLSTNTEVVKQWIKERQSDIETIASIPEVRSTVLSLAEKTGNTERLRNSEEARKLREILSPIVERHGYLGFVVFDRTGLQIAALFNHLVGSRDLMSQSDFVQRALRGETVVSLPFLDKSPLPGREDRELRTNRPTMFMATPVRNATGEVAAVFSFRLQPEIQFTHVMETSRIGKTGETYAFNAEGLLLSDSRFNQQLRDLGLIPNHPDSHAILTVRLQAPNQKSSPKSVTGHPAPESGTLTRMAASAIKGESGIDVEGYHGYRGIPVIGAWVWLKEYGFGLATEMDTSEAFVPTLKKLFLNLLGLLSLAMIIAFTLQVRHLRARKSLKSVMERERSVMSNIMDGIVTIDSKGVIETFNPAAERVFGYTAAEVAGKNISLLMPEPYRGEHNEYLRRYSRTGKSRVLGVVRVAPGLRKNGEVFLLEISTSEVLLSENKMFIGVVRDITERRRAEEILKKKVTAVELLQVVAVAANAARTLEDALQSSLDNICRIIGWPVGHVFLLKPSGDNILESGGLWHLDDPVKFKAFKQVTERSSFAMGVGLPGRIWASGKPEWIADVTLDENFPRAKGRPELGVRAGFAFPVLVGKTVVAALEFFSSEPVERDENLLEVMQSMGTQLGHVIERKRAESNLMRYAADLERSNQELGDFTFIASHDLQEPLRKIVSFGDRLDGTARERLDAQGQLYLERMQTAALRARWLIDDLLIYSRITHEPRRFEPISLEEVIAGILFDLKEEIERIGARIEVGPLPTIETTTVQMRHLFHNLIANALKFRRKDTPPVITIAGRKAASCPWPGLPQAQPNTSFPSLDGSENSSEVTPLWEIAVKDNGVGFDSKYADRIFKPFKRLHAKEEFPGTGMGLAICQKIVTRMGGSITARSEPMGGAEFVVCLPEKQPRLPFKDEVESGYSTS